MSDEMSKCLRNNQAFSGEILNYTKSGRAYWNQLIIDPIFDAEGQLKYFVAFQYDTTARRNLEDLNKNIFASAGEAMIAVDSDGVITHFNQSASQLLGYPASEVVTEKNFFAFHAQAELESLAKELGLSSTDDSFAAATILPRLAPDKDSVYRRRCLLTRRDGSAVPVHLSISAVRQQDIRTIGYLGVARDLRDEQAQRDILERLELVAQQVPGLLFQLAMNTDGSAEFLYLSEGGAELIEANSDAAL